MSRLSSISCAGSRPKITTATAFQTLLATKAPWGRYSADSWVSGTNTLTDLTGNGRHATTSGVTNATASGNGATASIAYLSGGPTNSITFPAGSFPSTYTLCYVTRYSGATKLRILQASGSNSLFGHWNGTRGLVYINANFYTSSTSVGTVTDWAVECVACGNPISNNILLNGASVGTGVAPTVTTTQLCINNGGVTSEYSDFQFSQLIVWDQALTATEMATVSAALNTYLSTGVLQ